MSLLVALFALALPGPTRQRGRPKGQQGQTSRELRKGGKYVIHDPLGQTHSPTLSDLQFRDGRTTFVNIMITTWPEQWVDRVDQ